MHAPLPPASPPPSSRARLTLRVDGLTSDSAAHTLESALSDLPTLTATADARAATLHLEFDRSACALPEIAARMDRLGLRLRHTSTHAPHPARPHLAAGLARRVFTTILTNRELLCATLGGALLLGAVLNNLTGGPPALRYTLVGLSFLIAGYYTVIDAAKVLLALRFDIDVLMLAAAFGAAILGHFEEGAFLLVLFALGGAGEQLALDRARHAIESLSKLAPETALRLKPADNRSPDRSTGVSPVLMTPQHDQPSPARGAGVSPASSPPSFSPSHFEEVPVTTLQPGDLLLIRPYDRLPADGSVHTGSAAIDQSPITGESVPVDKHPGDSVFAGTINGDTALTVTVTKPSTQSTLSKIVRLVEEAQASKSPTQQFTEKVERVYVPFVLVSTAALMILPPALGLTFRLPPDTNLWSAWFYRACAFLTAASPCALAIGTPAAVLSGIARAARLGLLVKGGAHLENLSRIQAIAFDKTGTLTRGRPTLTDVIELPGFRVRGSGKTEVSSSLKAEPLKPDNSSALLRLAAAVEQTSSHPLAQAITAAAHSRHLTVPPATDVQQTPGVGISATVEGRRLTCSRPDTTRDPKLLQTANELSSEGKSLVLLSERDTPIALLALSDRPRHNAAAALHRLRAAGLSRTIMLTGDKRPVAEQIAHSIGIDETHADLMPQDKLSLIHSLQQTHGPLAMVGDGVNDAPALAAATVGIAMGSAGTDVALETADIALMGDDLQKLPDAIHLARFSRRIIKQNLTIALGTIAVLAPLCALGYTYLGIAVLFHEGSTVLVVLNSLRLLTFKPR